MARRLMQCGCYSVGNDQDGNPTCITHHGTPEGHKVINRVPDLSGRKARCGYCKKERASSTRLPFFEFTGPRSHEALSRCKNCTYTRPAHDKAVKDGDRPPGLRVCRNFESKGPAEFDRFYCGCRGWN